MDDRTYAWLAVATPVVALMVVLLPTAAGAQVVGATLTGTITGVTDHLPCAAVRTDLHSADQPILHFVHVLDGLIREHLARQVAHDRVHTD
jgi:hypothetical protein